MNLEDSLATANVGQIDRNLTIEAARWARRVIAVDRSAAVLARAKAMADRRKVKNIVWKRGTLERLPLKDRSIDVAVFSQALHHADPPEAALAEARRALRPGGRVIGLDLREHDETWVGPTRGDKGLGFSEDRLRRLLLDAGFENVIVRVGSRRSGDPFAVLIAGGASPAEQRT